MISHIASYFASYSEFRKAKKQLHSIPYGSYLYEPRHIEDGGFYGWIIIDTKEELKDKVNSDPGNIYIAPDKESLTHALNQGDSKFVVWDGMLLDAPRDIILLIVAPVDDTLPWSAYLEWSSKKNAWIVR